MMRLAVDRGNHAIASLAACERHHGRGRVHTNGRHPAPTSDTPAKRHLRIRPARLLVPVMLAVGVILIIRYFEQSTAS